MIITYYFSSGLQNRFTVSSLIMQINDKVLNRYIGFDLRKSLSYIKIFNQNIFQKFSSNKLENVFLEINQETILALELQRKIRSENGGELPNKDKIFHPANLKFNDENYRIKMRTKGVRTIHWKDKDKTSYKIDIRGDKRLWGMEEFSFQKPVTRNYTYEYLFHNLLGHVDLLRIKYFFINLYSNDQNLGVYAVEESFSKELIERQGRRNGPIFSIRDELGEYFPNIGFELYSDNFWISEYPKLTKNSFSILNNLKSEKFNINEHFDIDKWAKYFAIMDLTGAYHGSLIKSVKLYYNPTTALFEPIGYDLHKGAGIFNDFILIDFIQEEDSSRSINCNYICKHKEWYLKFLKLNNGKLNDRFVGKYIKYLKQFSEKGFLDNFINLYSKELKKYNQSIYADNSKVDKIFWTGAGYFIYDDDYLYNRAKLIKSRINSTNLEEIDISFVNNQFSYEDYAVNNFPILAETFKCQSTEDRKKYFLAGKMSFKLQTSCKKIKLTSNLNDTKIFELEENIRISMEKDINIKENFKILSDHKNVLKTSKNKYKVSSHIDIKKNSIIKKDQTFVFDKNSTINIINGSTLFVEGKVNFINDENNLTQIFSTDRTGSIIFNENDYNFKNLIFENLSKPNLASFIFFGGVNFINSNINLHNIYIKDSNNEDGINIINSTSLISNIYFENIKADAFDLDFGKLDFKNIDCKNINNDCLDISGAEVIGSGLYSKNTYDKGISVGENSNVVISDLRALNNNIGLAVKDGSFAKFKNISFDKNNYDIILFNKKKEFLKPSLIVHNLNHVDIDKILQSIDTKLVINNENYFGNLDDDFINSKIY